MARVTLREVTQGTLHLILGLKVAENQRGLVATNAKSIAQAHFCPQAWFRAIYADETPVGFTMLHIDTEKPEYYLWRFMIDERFQGLDYGRRALELIIDHVRNLPNAKELILSHVPRDGHPGPFYRKLGFEYTGEVDGVELVMKLVL